MTVLEKVKNQDCSQSRWKIKGFNHVDQELRYPWKLLILNKGSTVFYVFKSRSKEASKWVDTSKIAVKVDIALKNKVMDNNLTVLGASILTNILYLVFISPCDHKFSPPCFSLFEVLLSFFHSVSQFSSTVLISSIK